MLDYDKALEFAKLGYKAEDIKMLMEMDVANTSPSCDTPLPATSTQDDVNLDSIEAEHKKELEEATNKIEELQKQIKTLQDAAVAKDISGRKKSDKTDEEVLADFARSFM